MLMDFDFFFCKFRAKNKPTVLQVLCLYLMCEQAKGPVSDWWPYIKILPKSYSNPIYWTTDELSMLPDYLKNQANTQIRQVESLFEGTRQIRECLESAYPEFRDNLTLSLFYWAWCTVNTRSVYMEQKKHKCLENTEKDRFALAPFLDLLNHKPDVQVIILQ